MGISLQFLSPPTLDLLDPFQELYTLSIKHLIASRERDSSARLSLGGNIQRNIGRQLRLLRRQLTRASGIPLCDLNLDAQNIGLELENLVLYLAVLEGNAGGGLGARSGDGVVEAASCGFGGLGESGGL